MAHICLMSLTNHPQVHTHPHTQKAYIKNISPTSSFEFNNTEWQTGRHDQEVYAPLYIPFPERSLFRIQHKLKNIKQFCSKHFLSAVVPGLAFTLDYYAFA